MTEERLDSSAFRASTSHLSVVLTWKQMAEHIAMAVSGQLCQPHSNSWRKQNANFATGPVITATTMTLPGPSSAAYF